MNFTERFGFKATNPNLQSAAIMVDKFITRYPLDQINQAIDDAHHGKCIKPVLVFA